MALVVAALGALGWIGATGAFKKKNTRESSPKMEKKTTSVRGDTWKANQTMPGYHLESRGTNQYAPVKDPPGQRFQSPDPWQKTPYRV